MPLTPIRFNSPEDVTAFLDHLRKKNLLPTDPTAPLRPQDLHNLTKQLIIGNDYETYLLCDIKDLPASDVAFSSLAFLGENFTFTPLSARHTINNNSRLVHNAPLAQELVKLIPNMDFFEIQPQCKLSGKLTLFPCLTMIETTIESMSGVELSMRDDLKDPQLNFKGCIPNRALLDLQLATLQHLLLSNTLSAKEINEKINVVQTNLEEMKARINKFCAKYPETRAVKLKTVVMGEDHSNLIARRLHYIKNISDARHDVGIYQAEVKRRAKHLKILAALSELIVTLPVLGYKAYSYHQTKKILAAYITRLENLERIREEVVGKQLGKVYALFLDPYLRLIECLQQNLKPIEKFTSKPVYTPSSVQHTLLPPQQVRSDELDEVGDMRMRRRG